jgi:hypothetical protein
LSTGLSTGFCGKSEHYSRINALLAHRWVPYRVLLCVDTRGNATNA